LKNFRQSLIYTPITEAALAALSALDGQRIGALDSNQVCFPFGYSNA
jgi:hypothetical protein